MKNALDISILPAESWRPADAGNGRNSDRTSERELERIPAWLEWTAVGHGVAGKTSARLWDYSQSGFAILIDGSKTGKQLLHEGDAVTLILDLGQGPMPVACEIRNCAPFRNSVRIGLTRKDLGGLAAGKGYPIGEFLRIPPQIDIPAETANPLLFGERSILRLAGIHSGLVMDFVTTDGSMPVCKGLELELNLVLPTSGDNLYRGRIESVDLVEGGKLRLRLQPLEVSGSLANDLAEILAQESDVTPDTLKRLGFPIRFFRKRLVFRFVETMEEYGEVLNLRRNAYVEAAKRPEETIPEEMSLDWDRSSRILCAFHEGKLIASAALTFPFDESYVLRTETAFPDSRFPMETLPKTELMEVNSLCTHKDYRRGDLLHAMFEQIGRIFILSDRKCIMNLSDGNLLPMYKRIGFRDLGHTGIFLGREHHLIRLTKEAITLGKGMPLIDWTLVYGDMMADILEKRMLPFTLAEACAIRAKLVLRGLIKRLNGARREKEFQRTISGSEGENRDA